MMISEHLSYEEATKSVMAYRLGMSNEPRNRELENMRHVAAEVFEPVRRVVCQGRPLAVTSFFRSVAVNNAVGGVPTSQHCRGEAMDIDAHVYGNGTNREIFEYIRDWLVFDQLIWEEGTAQEPAWVHVSLKSEGNRRQSSGASLRLSEK